MTENTKSQMIMRIAELSEQNSALKTELKAQKEIYKACEVEYFRLEAQYKAVVNQNRQLQQDIKAGRLRLQEIIALINKLLEGEDGEVL